MSKFTPGEWEVQKREAKYLTLWSVVAPGKTVSFGFIDPADARLIAAAPEMYNWIEKACCFLHDLKRYAHDEDEMRAHAEDMNATYDDLLTEAYLLLVRIDGEDVAHE